MPTKKDNIESKTELIECLKKAKVERESKWIYNLVAWALKNQEKVTYQKFQNRINSTIHYTKGKYKEYWDNPKNKEKHKKQMEKLRKEKKVKYQEMSDKYNKELKIAYKLYKEGKLSNKSMIYIEKEIEKNKLR